MSEPTSPAEQALSRLAQIAVEYVQSINNMPATREAVAMYVQEAVNTVRDALRGGGDGAPSA